MLRSIRQGGRGVVSLSRWIVTAKSVLDDHYGKGGRRRLGYVQRGRSEGREEGSRQRGVVSSGSVTSPQDTSGRWRRIDPLIGVVGSSR